MNTENIYQRMSAITADLATVAKNLTVDTGGGKSYRAVSERDIIDAVKPLELKHGVYSYPVDREVLSFDNIDVESTYKGEVKHRTTFFSRIKTVYRFVNVDKPEEYIDTTTFAEGIDSQDKGSGKAMTYADKYALMKAYKISTGDDPDQSASRDLHDPSPEPEGSGLVQGEEADRIISGLKFIAGDKTDAQKELLKMLTDGKYDNVYKLPYDDGLTVYETLLRMGREKQKGSEPNAS